MADEKDVKDVKDVKATNAGNERATITPAGGATTGLEARPETEIRENADAITSPADKKEPAVKPETVVKADAVTDTSADTPVREETPGNTAATPKREEPAKPPAPAATGSGTATAEADAEGETEVGADGQVRKKPVSKFMDKKCSIFCEHFKVDKVTPHLEEVLKDGAWGKDPQGNLMLKLNSNEHVIQCGKAPNGIEYIAHVTPVALHEIDAKAMVAMAKSRGWEEINLAGSQQDKELLWIEAQRQKVRTTWNPDPESEIAKKWAAEQRGEKPEDPANPKQPIAAITNAAEVRDYHVDTIKLLQEKTDAAGDKADVKDALKAVFKKFQDGVVLSDKDTFEALTKALSDTDARKGYNAAADYLNKKTPSLALPVLAEPESKAAASGPTASAPAPVA